MVKKNNKYSFVKKLQNIAGFALVGVFALGVIGVSASTNEAAYNLKTSIFDAQQTTAHNRIARSITKNKAIKGDPAVISCTDISSDPAAYKGEFIARNVTLDLVSEKKLKVSLYLKNTGTSPWISDESGCTGKPFMRIGTARSHDHSSPLYTATDGAWHGTNRIAMKDLRVEPNEIATFSFVVSAPKENDIYKEFFQPVVEGVRWIEDRAATTELLVRVGTTTPELDRKAFLLGHSGKASTLNTEGEMNVHVDLSKQQAHIRLGEAVIREYVVSTGAYKTPTPTGRYKILSKEDLRIGRKSPHYRMPYFQMLTPTGVGFHALPYLANDKGSFWKEALTNIGRRVSHGCVRMLPEDAEDFFAITEIGTPVVIHY